MSKTGETKKCVVCGRERYFYSSQIKRGVWRVLLYGMQAERGDVGMFCLREEAVFPSIRDQERVWEVLFSGVQMEGRRSREEEVSDMRQRTEKNDRLQDRQVLQL